MIELVLAAQLAATTPHEAHIHHLHVLHVQHWEAFVAGMPTCKEEDGSGPQKLPCKSGPQEGVRYFIYKYHGHLWARYLDGHTEY